MFSPPIVWYLFLAGVGSGAFLVAAATMAVHHRATHRTPAQASSSVHYHRGTRADCSHQALHINAFSRFGIELRQSLNPSENHIRISGSLIISTVCIVAASLSLLATFKNPFAVWRVVLNPFISLTSFGATALVIFVALSALIAFITLFKLRLPHWLFAVLMILGALAAFSTMLYAGFLLALIVSVDLWRTVLVPLLFVTSSLTCGLAASLFVEVIQLGIRASGFKRRWRFLLFFTLAEMLAVVALLIERAGFSSTALESVNLLLFGNEAWPFWLGIVSLGLGLPLVLHTLFPRLPLEALVLVSTAGTLIGGFFIRYCIVNAGLMTPVLPLN